MNEHDRPAAEDPGLDQRVRAELAELMNDATISHDDFVAYLVRHQGIPEDEVSPTIELLIEHGFIHIDDENDGYGKGPGPESEPAEPADPDPVVTQPMPPAEPNVLVVARAAAHEASRDRELDAPLSDLQILFATGVITTLRSCSTAPVSNLINEMAGTVLDADRRECFEAIRRLWLRGDLERAGDPKDSDMSLSIALQAALLRKPNNPDGFLITRYRRAGLITRQLAPSPTSEAA